MNKQMSQLRLRLPFICELLGSARFGVWFLAARKPVPRAAWLLALGCLTRLGFNQIALPPGLPFHGVTR
jgi:hypothetical protein